MSRKAKPKRKKKQKSQAVPFLLVGAGLIIIAVLAFIFLSGNDTKEVASDNGAPSGPPSAIPAAVEFPAPQLTLADLNGKPVSLEDYRGEVVLVNHWAIWCPPCKAELPVLNAYYEDMKKDGFVIVGIEAGEPVEQVADFISQVGITYPIWPDPGKEGLYAFKVSSLPSSFVIDRDGTVRLAWTGAISREMLDKYVTPIVKE